MKVGKKVMEKRIMSEITVLRNKFGLISRKLTTKLALPIYFYVRVGKH